MAEKEYIEREAALNAIKDEIENYRPNPDPYSITPYELVRRGLNIAYSIIKNQPTADVQEVVRCKDCIHCCMSYDPKANTSHQICGYVGYNPVQSSEVTDYDFCSKGERMIDSENNC